MRSRFVLGIGPTMTGTAVGRQTNQEEKEMSYVSRFQFSGWFFVLYDIGSSEKKEEKREKGHWLGRPFYPILNQRFVVYYKAIRYLTDPCSTHSISALSYLIRYVRLVIQFTPIPSFVLLAISCSLHINC